MRLLSVASKIQAIPGLHWLSPSAEHIASAEDKEGFLACQKLAMTAVQEISALITEGWSERQAAKLIESFLRDSGVKAFFHYPFVWYGERTRFDGVKTYYDYLPTERIVRPNEVYIFDVAPIYRGYICDIGFSRCLGQNAEYDAATKYLDSLRQKIPALFSGATSGEDIWRNIDREILAAGYDNIHAMYPFSVLGHRVHRIDRESLRLKFINFGWQSYWSILSRGLFGQLLNANYHGSLKGLWAIEPHIGTESFGIKFEEILVVDADQAYWLADWQQKVPVLRTRDNVC